MTLNLFRMPAFTSSRIKLFGLAALAGAALLLGQTLAAPRAHAGEPMPPGVQQIVLPSQVSINVDKSYYYPGEWIQICYHVPGNGFFQILDKQPGQPPKVLKSGTDFDGFGCFWGQVTPPYGTETLTLVYYAPWYEGGGTKTANTSFHVVWPY
jgi:hypothetical protein